LQADGGVQLAIFQPRRPLGEAGQKLYLSAEWVATERHKLAREVAAVDSAADSLSRGDLHPREIVRPGDHCRYCKAAAKCPATAQGVQAALDTNAGLRSVLDMPEDDLLALYASRTAIKNLMEDIEERVSQLAKTGSAKICVETKSGRRMWRNPKEATLTLLALGLDGCLAPGPLSEVLDRSHPRLPNRSESTQRVLTRTLRTFKVFLTVLHKVRCYAQRSLEVNRERQTIRSTANPSSTPRILRTWQSPITSQSSRTHRSINRASTSSIPKSLRRSTRKSRSRLAPAQICKRSPQLSRPAATSQAWKSA
jgi:hypothetical protein